MKSLLLLIFLSCLQPLVAQLNLTIEMERTNFVSHEAVNALVKIQNLAGKDIALGGPSGQSWLQFNLQRADGGNVLATDGDPKVEPTMLKAGATITKKINLARFYPLDEPASYLVSCTAYFSDLQRWIGSSNKALVRVNSARAPFYERTVGVPVTHPQAGRYRRYRLFTSKSTMKSAATGLNQEVQLLYVGITDEETEENIATYPLGPILTYRDPQPTTDRAGNLSVLYMASPQLYQYVMLDVDGAVKEQQTYKTSGATPELVQSNTGNVRVRGGVIFDAINEETKAREEKNKIRGLNERPQ